jgi:hypothetical protein
MAGTARQYHHQHVTYLRKRVNYNDSGVATGVLVGTLPAGAIITDVTTLIATAFNAATTNVMNVGTTTTGAEVGASAQILAGAAGSKKPTAYQSLGPMAADTDIWVSYTQTGTAATTGIGYVVVSYIPNNDL